MSYENIWEKHGVYRKCSGRVTGKEILQAVQEVESDNRFDLIRYVINDFLDVTEVDVSFEEIKLIAAIDNAAALTNPNIKVAQVTINSGIEDLAKFYSDRPGNNRYPSKLFLSLDEAREWVAYR